MREPVALAAPFALPQGNAIRRRSLLQWMGLCVVPLPLWARAGSGVQLHIMDRRLGLTLPQGAVGLDADVSMAWFERIAPALGRMGTQGQVTGVSQGDALFCLQALALDRGWRVDRCESLQTHLGQVPVQGLVPNQVYAWSMRFGVPQRPE